MHRTEKLIVLVIGVVVFLFLGIVCSSIGAIAVDGSERVIWQKASGVSETVGEGPI